MAYSQSNEDEIAEHLIKSITEKTFLEIGWGYGNENNSLNLIKKHGFTGVGVDQIKEEQQKLKHERFTYISKKCTIEDAEFLVGLVNPNPGFFSIDIDSIDYFLLKEMLSYNFRPMIICHEYNSIFGPTLSYARKANAKIFDKKSLYGASLSAYRKLLSVDYNFITVSNNGVNAFWLRKDIKAIPFKDASTFEYIKSKYNKKEIEDKITNFSVNNLDEDWEEV
jgi:hypothetical protein